MTSVTNAVNLEGMLILEGSIEDKELGCFRVGKVSVNMASAMGAVWGGAEGHYKTLGQIEQQ